MVSTTAIRTLPSIDWRVTSDLVGYPDAVAEMEARVAHIRAGQASELVWCLEHPSLFTAGTSAADTELLDDMGLPVYRTGRGGRFTWHGPGQRVSYVMMDLKARGSDVRAFVRDLEAWIIATLEDFGIHGERRDGRVGIWVDAPGGEAKIAAIGVRVRHWVSYHGIALNVDPDLSAYRGIIPCGLSGFGVTSIHGLGISATMAEVDAALRSAFERVFKRKTASA